MIVINGAQKNVGIGTISPSAKLEVKKSGTIGGVWNPSGSFFSISDSGSGMLIMDTNEIYGNSVLHIGSSGEDVVRFRSVSESGAIDRMIIKNDGSVGIGTTTPNAKFQVKDGANMSISLGAISTSVNNTSSEEPVILLNRWSGNSNMYVTKGIETLRVNPNGPYYGLAFTRTPLHVENDYSNSYVSMYIENSNGYVGIGTTTPDEKLSVNGNIHTKEVRVDLIGWSDFVFNDDYNLPTLQEVESHIKDKGHLKDIPSAKEVAENGILLGEMDSKLLQKIEELVLYTIEQEKSLEQKKEKIKYLEDKLESQEARIQKIEKMLTSLK